MNIFVFLGAVSKPLQRILTLRHFPLLRQLWKVPASMAVQLQSGHLMSHLPLPNPIILSCLHSHPPDRIRGSWIRARYPPHTHTHTHVRAYLMAYISTSAFQFGLIGLTVKRSMTINRFTGWTDCGLNKGRQRITTSNNIHRKLFSLILML